MKVTECILHIVRIRKVWYCWIISFQLYV